MHFRLGLRLTAAFAALALVAGASHAETVPPAGYRFETAAPCRDDAARAAKPSRPGQAAYDVCADQMALFAKGLAEARAEKKLLLITFGATWCSWCASLQKAMPTSELLGHKSEALDIAATFHHIELALSTLDKGANTDIPSGHAVLRLLLQRAEGAKLRAIPFIAVVEPGRMERTFARNVDDLATKDGSYDFARLRRILAEARDFVRGEGAGPVEPGWLKRKWLRFWAG